MENTEDRWFDNNLGLVSGISEILDLRCFYHHLREECQCNLVRILNFKKAIATMREQIFELFEQLKYCLPLGTFLTNLRRFYKTKNNFNVILGHQTIKVLENAGIKNLQDLGNLQKKI